MVTKEFGVVDELHMVQGFVLKLLLLSLKRRDSMRVASGLLLLFSSCTVHFRQVDGLCCSVMEPLLVSCQASLQQEGLAGWLGRDLEGIGELD